MRSRVRSGNEPTVRRRHKPGRAAGGQRNPAWGWGADTRMRRLRYCLHPRHPPTMGFEAAEHEARLLQTLRGYSLYVATSLAITPGALCT